MKEHCDVKIQKRENVSNAYNNETNDIHSPQRQNVILQQYLGRVSEDMVA